MSTNASSRNPALDVLRYFALFCVVGVHFFANSGLYGVPVMGKSMYLMTLLRSFFMICVPLFLMLSGYLMKNKKPTRQYFLGISKVLILYLLASLCTGAYHIYAAKTFWGETVSLWKEFLGLFSFSTAPYGWYIGMYIGLYLLIPYLNILYDNLGSQRSRRNLILIFLLLTAMPGIANIHCLTDASWWLSPSSSDACDPLLPSWWISMFPITYYYLGAYLRDYPLNIKKSVNLLCIGLTFVAVGSYSYYRCYPGNFIIGIWDEHASILTVIQSVLVFQFFAGLDFSRCGRMIRRILAFLSDLCLGAYLVSWIFDQQVYSALADLVPQAEDRLQYFLPVVLTVYFRSLCLSALVWAAYTLIRKVFSLCKRSVSMAE